MLVISRRKNQSLQLGPDIEIKILQTRNEQVKLGIVAPQDVSVIRMELLERVRQSNLASLSLDPAKLGASPLLASRKQTSVKTTAVTHSTIDPRVTRAVSKMVHDIRNFLTPLDGELQLTLLDCQEPEMAESLETAMRQGRDLLEFLDDISLAAGRSLPLGPCEPLTNCLDRWKAGAEKRFSKHRFRIDRGGVGEVGFPQTQPGLDEILMELTRNAVEAGHPADETPIELEVKQQGQALLLCLRDTGQGFEKTVMERACDPYFSTREEHSGLGLTRVLGWCRSFEGELRLASGPGKGAEVTLKLELPRSPR